MEKVRKILICLLMVFLSMSSCTKDLQIEPISQISNASFWKSADDANGALYGMYGRLRVQAASNFFMWGEARSEVVGRSLGAGLDAMLYLHDNSLDRNKPGPDWQGLYTVLHDANLILKYVPNINFTSKVAKNNILAQAHTMRAFVYFLMVKTWGDVPMVTEPTEGYDPGTLQRDRTPKEQIFKLIKQDIDEAIKLFPDNNFSQGRNVWSLPSANALKADVYLWTGKRLNGGNADMTIALNALNEVEKADVSLLNNFASVFDYSNKGNKEIIMAVRFQELETGSTWYSNMYISDIYLPANTSAATKNAIGVLGGGAYWTVSAGVRNQFSNQDQRKNASFIEIYTYKQVGDSTYYGSVVSKFNGIVNSGVRNFLDDVVIYRYADILLMKAEAKNALGQDPSAEVNQVRKRAYGNNFTSNVFVNGSKEKNDEEILKERLLELALEGKRWWDLIRFGKVFEKVPSLQNRLGQDYLLLFPISQNILSLETKVKQNPGY